jgi:hypothetical protein
MTTYKHQKVDPAHTMVRKLLQMAVVWLLVAVAMVSLALFTAAGWAEKQVLNTENWVSFVTPLPKDPVVADALGGLYGVALIRQRLSQAKGSRGFARPRGSPGISADQRAGATYQNDGYQGDCR